MERLWVGFIFTFLLSSCASKPIFSSKLLIESAKEDLQSAKTLADSAQKAYGQYIGAHKHMLKAKSLGDKEKMRALHKLIKEVRTQALVTFMLKKEIQADVKFLEKELGVNLAISEGSDIYKKVEPKIKLYGLGNPHPNLKASKDAFKKALDAYMEKLGEYSGYLTDKSSLKSHFDRSLMGLTSRLNEMVLKVKGEVALVNRISQIKLQLSDLQAKFYGELPEQSKKVLLFPNMISYSVMDRLSAVDEQLKEIAK